MFKVSTYGVAVTYYNVVPALGLTRNSKMSKASGTSTAKKSYITINHSQIYITRQ